MEIKFTEEEIEEIFGKSIWNMTTQELIENNLEDDWFRLVEANAKNEQ